MALNPKLSYAAVNLAADAIGDTLDAGLIKIYNGRQPNAVNSAVFATHVLLAELTLNAAGFGASSAGVITAGAITSDAAANTTGTATWFRILQPAGNTAMFDGSVGTASANLVLNSVSIQADAVVAISALTVTIPRSA